MNERRTNTEFARKEKMRYKWLPVFGFILLLLFPALLAAQLPERPPVIEDAPVQSIYLEAGGNGILLSLNYDLVFSNNYGIRLGVSGVPRRMGTGADSSQPLLDMADSPYFFAIIMGNYFAGSGNNNLELGGGLLLGEVLDENEWDRPGPTAATFTAAYRYLNREEGGITLRAGITPMIEFSGGLHLRFGVSVGWTL